MAMLVLSYMRIWTQVAHLRSCNKSLKMPVKNFKGGGFWERLGHAPNACNKAQIRMSPLLPLPARQGKGCLSSV
eukprot:297939-Amphidinium_carterae.1